MCVLSSVDSMTQYKNAISSNLMWHVFAVFNRQHDSHTCICYFNFIFIQFFCSCCQYTTTELHKKSKVYTTLYMLSKVCEYKFIFKIQREELPSMISLHMAYMQSMFVHTYSYHLIHIYAWVTLCMLLLQLKSKHLQGRVLRKNSIMRFPYKCILYVNFTKQILYCLHKSIER